MTVKELIAHLAVFPQDAQVIIARDRAGNGYSPADALDEAHYTAETTWRGEIDDEDDSRPPNAVVIWPVH